MYYLGIKTAPIPIEARLLARNEMGKLQCCWAAGTALPCKQTLIIPAFNSTHMVPILPSNQTPLINSIILLTGESQSANKNSSTDQNEKKAVHTWSSSTRSFSSFPFYIVATCSTDKQHPRKKCRCPHVSGTAREAQMPFFPFPSFSRQDKKLNKKRKEGKQT